MINGRHVIKQNLIKGMLSGRVAKHGFPRGGKILIKGMLYLNFNY